MNESTDAQRVREILARAKMLGAEYYRLTEKPLGVTGEVAEYGDGFVLHDSTSASTETEKNLSLDAFRSPADLWERYREWKGLSPEAEKVVLQDYFEDGSGKAPRHYPGSELTAANRWAT